MGNLLHAVCSVTGSVQCALDSVKCALGTLLGAQHLQLPFSQKFVVRDLQRPYIFNLQGAVQCEFGSVPLTSDSIVTFTPCTICIQVTHRHKMFRRFTRHSERSLYWDIYTPTYRNGGFTAGGGKTDRTMTIQTF